MRARGRPMYANLNARMATLFIFGFLAIMINNCYSYPPHYLDFWQHDPPAYSPHVDPWNNENLPSSGSDRSSSRRIDSTDDHYHNHNHNQNHHQQYPEHRHEGRNDHAEGNQSARRRVEQQSPSYSNVGLYGNVPSRDGAGVRVADGPGANVPGQNHEFPNHVGGTATGRRKARPHVNGDAAPNSHSSDIYFPGDFQANGFVPVVADKRKGPECARGSTFCEQAEGYPKDYLTTLLQKEAREYMDLFGRDEVESTINVTNRIDSNDDVPLCNSIEEVVFPQAAQNKDDEWLYIVNQDKYMQGVRVEKCLDTSGKCGFFELPLNYETGCKQKYIYRKLLALNGTSFVSDTFRLPSCCSCFIRNSRAGTRIGANPFMVPSKQTPVPEKSRSTGYN